MEARADRPAKRYRSILLLVAIVLLLGVLILLQGKDSFLSHRNRVKVGMQAPDFAFPGLDGKVVRLSDHKGKVIFLNIWATWCPPCREEMPSIETLYQKMKGKDFEILAVSIDALGAKSVAPFIKKYRLTFPVLLDAGATIQNLYATTGVPETYIIDKKGIIVKKTIGSRNWASPETIHFLQGLVNGPLSKK